MVSPKAESAAKVLPTGLPQRIDQVFRPWAETSRDRPAEILFLDALPANGRRA